MALLTKLCHCGMKNPTSAFECEKCGVDITTIEPSDNNAHHHEAIFEQTSGQTNSSVLWLSFPLEVGGLISVTSCFRIGRDPAFSDHAEGLAKFPKVSKRHAEITLIDGVFFLTDLDSTNGTYVNGRRLNPRDPVELSGCMQLMFSTMLEVTAMSQGT